MSRGKQVFTKRAAQRAIRAVQDAGLPIQVVEITKEGNIIVKVGDPVHTVQAVHNPWDEETKRGEPDEAKITQIRPGVRR